MYFVSGDNSCFFIIRNVFRNQWNLISRMYNDCIGMSLRVDLYEDLECESPQNFRGRDCLGLSGQSLSKVTVINDFFAEREIICQPLQRGAAKRQPETGHDGNVRAHLRQFLNGPRQILFRKDRYVRKEELSG